MWASRHRTMPQYCKRSLKFLFKHVSLGIMNRAFIGFIKDDIFSDGYFLMKCVFSHTDGTSILYDISWELFTWKSINILDSVYICWNFPTWGCWTYIMSTELSSLHSYSKIHITFCVIKVWHRWNHKDKCLSDIFFVFHLLCS